MSTRDCEQAARAPILRGIAQILSFALLTLVVTRVRALDPEGAPITTSDYSIDLTQGPVLSTSRITGLAGASTALAEGLEGGLSNPAAAAARSAGSVDFWDYWLAFGLTYPFQNGDFYNSGSYLEGNEDVDDDSFLFLNTGAYLQIFGVGAGLDLEILQVKLEGKGDLEGNKVRLQLITNHVQLGSLFFDGQLAVGVGLQILRERTTAKLADEDRRKLNNNTGFGGELGVLVRPNGKQWRIGAGLYSRVRTKYDTTVHEDAPSVVTPQYAERPWRGNLGFAYQFGRRPLNPRFSYVEEHARQPLHELDERVMRARKEHELRLAELRRAGGSDSLKRIAEEERDFAQEEQLLEAEELAIRKASWRALRAGVRTKWDRRYILVTGEVSFSGRVENGVGLESFLAQTVQRSGQHVSVTPRIGAESEVWPTYLKLRAGVYLEPTRFAESKLRTHGTFGFDVRLFRWDVFRIWPEDYLWQLSSALDIARDYQSFSVGFGGWY